MKKIEKIKYPRYTREQNLACKLKTKDIEQIKYLYDEGNSQRYLAKKFKVNKTTIQYWVTPHYREKVLRASSANAKKRREADPKLFNAIHYQAVLKAKKRKKSTRLKNQYRKWENMITRRRYIKKHDLILQQSKKRYKENYVYGNKPKPWIIHKKKCSMIKCENKIQKRNSYCRSCAQKNRKR